MVDGPVIHVNDVSGVAQTLVSGLTRVGQPAELFQPAVGTYNAGPLARAALVVRRPLDALRLSMRAAAVRARFFHVHFGAMGWLAWPSRLRYVLHLHGSDVRGPRPYNVALTRLALPRADLVLFATPDLAPAIRRVRPDAVFFPNPIDVSIFRPSTQEPRFDVLVASKLDHGKGVDMAITALACLKRSGWHGRIAMLSFGSDAPWLRELAQRQLGDVHWISRTDRAGMTRVYGGATVVIGQLQTGALGLTELEVLAVGRPLVASWGYPGWYPAEPPLCNARTPDEVASAVARLLADGACRRDLERRGPAWVRRFHSAEATVAGLIQLYRDRGLL